MSRACGNTDAPLLCKEPTGALAAEVDGYRLVVQPPAHAGEGWAYTVLRRQYGRGSLFGLVGSGREGSLTKAVYAAERLAGRMVSVERMAMEQAAAE